MSHLASTTLCRMDDSDVEFEDEWEEVQHADPSVALRPAAGHFTINLNLGDIEEETGNKKKKGTVGRAYTKHEREDALQVHRAHTLCLLAHALLHDRAAADAELQALLLSMLPCDLLDVASAAASSEDASAAGWLPNLLRWFHRTFNTTAVAHSRRRSSSRAADAPSSAPSWQAEMMQDLGFSAGTVSVQEQLLVCVADRRGSCEQLAALLVALLRGVGFLTRSVWSLEPLPLRPAAVEALQRSKSSGSLKSRAASAPAPHAAAAAAAADSLARSKSTASQRGRKRVHAAASVASSGTAAAASAGDEANGIAPVGGSKRQRRATSSSNKPVSKQAAAAEGKAADMTTAAAADAKQASKRKGDEEFELQLAMALASTAAEAESRAKAAASSGNDKINANPGRPPGALGHSRGTKPGGATGAGSLADLIHRGARPDVLKAAAQQAAASTPKGWLWGPNPRGLGAVPCAWAEVYIGSSAHGRWLHVDGQLGCWDQPEVVEAATARNQPLSYVVACQAGTPKDVTRRYAANFTVNHKWRDEAWWLSTMAALRSTGAHLPRQLAAQCTTTADAAATATAGAAIAAAGGGGADAGRLQHAVEQATTQHQQQQQLLPKRRKQGDQQQQAAQADKQRDGGGNADKQQLRSSQAAMPGAASAAAATDIAAGDAGDAALRAAREDAELSARAAVQAAGAPTTIQGFKDHPLYILERHIPQKQALVPGAAKLGMHKGEPYYARKDVQELHTRAHWRRLGRDVKASELPNPVKTTKKRTISAAAAARGGWGSAGRGRGTGFGGPGGWGPWQREKAAAKAAGTPADGDEFDGELPAAAAAAAVAAGVGAGAASGQGSSDMQLLYGLWQTEDWEPPPAVDGKVPRNEHGNTEVPPFTKALPKGTAHLALPNMGPICRSLGIDYSPALVGFDVQGGRNLPKILGVVICEEFEEAVMQLYLERQAERAAAEAKRQQREVEAAWRCLLSSMWTRLQLQRKYGTDPAAAAEATEEFVSATAAAAAVATAGSARDIVQKMHAFQGQQQQLRTLDNAAAASVAAGQQAARARGGMGQQRPRLPLEVAAVAKAAAAAVIGTATAADDGATATAELADHGHLEGVEIEEF